ncbi:hypothetical protein Hanom_Chr07g00584411 [Helianthus anomalus]
MELIPPKIEQLEANENLKVYGRLIKLVGCGLWRKNGGSRNI